MKKKCTNNKCRKYFTVKENTSCCPYCGKKYPRLRGDMLNKGDCNTDLSHGFWNKEAKSFRKFHTAAPKKEPKGVYLMNHEIGNKIKVIMVVKKWMGLGVKEAKELVESAPVLIKPSYINHTYLLLKELTGERITSDDNPLEPFIKELDETGCLYKILYKLEDKSMDVRDVESLKNWLSRLGDLDSENEDLIDNAIWCLKYRDEYRAISTLKGLASNLKNAGKTEAAKGVERLL